MAGLVIKDSMPDVVKDVVQRTIAYMKERLSEKDFKLVAANYYFSFLGDLYPDCHEWALGSNFEDGSHSIIYNVDSKEWKYRDPWTGKDRLVKGGADEAVAHLAALYVDI
jgi:hypothetical protein